MEPSILTKIHKYKLIEIKNKKAANSQKSLEEIIPSLSPPRGFIKSIIKASKTRFALIAEIKKASPSKGLIRADFNVTEIAKAYTRAGATCLSVLTDNPSFQGSNEYLHQTRVASSLPLLRKDFMYDPYQIYESKVIGADCVLIIMAAVSDAQAKELEDTAIALKLDVLIEVHNAVELGRALTLKSSLIGINNRNLNTFNVDLDITRSLAKLIPRDKIIVTESGITGSNDILSMYSSGARAFLIGESLMRQKDIEKATNQLLQTELVEIGK